MYSNQRVCRGILVVSLDTRRLSHACRVLQLARPCQCVQGFPRTANAARTATQQQVAEQQCASIREMCATRRPLLLPAKVCSQANSSTTADSQCQPSRPLRAQCQACSAVISKLPAPFTLTDQHVWTYCSVAENREYERAKNSAIGSLSLRPHSRKELVDKLSDKGYNEKAISRALDRLQELVCFPITFLAQVDNLTEQVEYQLPQLTLHFTLGSNSAKFWHSLARA